MVRHERARPSCDGMKRIDSCKVCTAIDALDESSLCIACAPIPPRVVVVAPVRLAVPRNVLVRLAPAS